MIPTNLDVNKLHSLFMEGFSISEIALETEAAESEIHYALSQLRKKDPDKWPKRNSGYARKTAPKQIEPEVVKAEPVKIESSFPRILPPSGKANSEVVTRKMTPEEMDRLNGMGKQTTDSMGAKLPKVFNYGRQPTPPAKEPVQIKLEEPIEMKTELTKELYLSEKAAGKNNAKIERDWNLKPNYIYQLLKLWKITGAKATPSTETQPSEGIIGKPGVSGAGRMTETLPEFNLAMENQLDLSEFKDAEIERLNTNLKAAMSRIKDYEKALVEPDPTPAPAIDNKLAAVQKYIRDLLGMDPVQVIYDQIAVERDRQDELHPLPDGFPSDLRMEILVEKVGEVAKAKMEGNQMDMRKELIEVAAVAVRWVEMLDRES